MYKKIAIIDFGSQFTQLIARRIRELNCYSEIFYPENFNFTEKDVDEIKGIILSGSHKSIEDYFNYKELLASIIEINKDYQIPILGICYGKQLLCNFFGATVEAGNSREYGRAFLTIEAQSLLTANIPNEEFIVWMSHGDTVVNLPENFIKIASTKDCSYAIIVDDERKIYGIQFHPEVTHSSYGSIIINNFIKLCHLENSWSLQTFSKNEQEELLNIIKEEHVIAAVSGGVDSTVAAKFLQKIIPQQVHCFFINTGLLRKNDIDKVKNNFENLNIPLEIIDASASFYKALSGIGDPEEKRKAIGRTFIEIFEAEAKKIKSAKFLLQGTLYPDVVESGAKGSHTIKSHHNVGGLPEKMGLTLIEPFKLLFKDEVRALGKLMGINDEILFSHPFPGPGLAVRILGEISIEKIHILQEVDDIFINGLKEKGLYGRIWQAFAVLLPVKSVGVMGDKRTYNYVCALRAVTALDGMTADSYPFEEKDPEKKLLFLDFLNEISTKIVNKVKGVSRVVYDITSKPPATIEWE